MTKNGLPFGKPFQTVEKGMRPQAEKIYCRGGYYPPATFAFESKFDKIP